MIGDERSSQTTRRQFVINGVAGGPRTLARLQTMVRVESDEDGRLHLTEAEPADAGDPGDSGGFNWIVPLPV